MAEASTTTPKLFTSGVHSKHYEDGDDADNNDDNDDGCRSHYGACCSGGKSCERHFLTHAEEIP